jgi:ABC-type dipeptide/oligopeptide/nickel transport system permease subunit
VTEKDIGRTGAIMTRRRFATLSTLALGAVGATSLLAACGDDDNDAPPAQPPTPEWGAMLSTGRDFMHQAWWIATFPGLAIVVAVLGFNLLGDGLRDVLDPRGLE